MRRQYLDLAEAQVALDALGRFLADGGNVSEDWHSQRVRLTRHRCRHRAWH